MGNDIKEKLRLRFGKAGNPQILRYTVNETRDEGEERVDVERECKDQNFDKLTLGGGVYF